MLLFVRKTPPERLTVEVPGNQWLEFHCSDLTQGKLRFIHPVCSKSVLRR